MPLVEDKFLPHGECYLDIDTDFLLKETNFKTTHVAHLLTLLIWYSLHRLSYHCTIAYLADCGTGFPSVLV